MTKGAPPPPALPALDFRPQDGVVSVEELAEFLRVLRQPVLGSETPALRVRPGHDLRADRCER